MIHSAARLTYDEVWGIVSGRDPVAIQRRAPLVSLLNDLYALFRQLLKARNQRGAVDFDTVETKIICDPAGRIQSIVAQERNDAHRLIEECMLGANTCAADFLVRLKHPGLYRVHEGPTPERLARLREFLGGLGLQIGEAGKDPTPQDYQVLSKAIAARQDAALLQTMMLRSMQQAIYTPINSGHFGLAYDAYAHYTSPIRRYPDLLNHRAIKALLAGIRYQPQVLTLAAEPPATDDDDQGAEDTVAAMKLAAAAAGARQTSRRPVRGSAEGAGAAAGDGRDGVELATWETLGIVCSLNERRADEATRDVEAWLKCQYMKERVGEQYRGRITGVAPFGIFVTLETLYVEGMVHVSDLGSEYFQYNEASHELRGERTGQRYRLTDEIDVQVSRVNLEGRRIDFRLVHDGSGRGPRGAGDGPAATEDGGASGAGRRTDAPAGKKAARGKTAAVREAQAARKSARQGNRGFKKAGGGQAPHPRKKR